MKNLNTIAFAIAALISLCTIAVGTYAWMHLEPSGLTWDQALYAAVLAIGGSDIYHNHPDQLVRVTRWLGAASALAIVFGFVALFAAGKIQRWLVGRMSNHLVLVGVNDFSLSYMLALKAPMQNLVLVDTEAALAEHASGRFGARVWRSPVDFIDEASLAQATGRTPAEIVFADPSASLNVERAQAVIAKRGKRPMRIRSEKQNISADLDIWSPEFADVPVLSETEFVARALVTELAPMNIARLREQGRPHIAIIGIGDMALGIIEEFALRCHAPDMGTLRVSTFDLDPQAAWKKLAMERDGLRRAIDMPETLPLNGVECGTRSVEADPLCAAADPDNSFTAIIVCTGDDDVNVDIALRLRRLQDEHGLCMAPILMRSRTAASVAPDPVTDLSGGLYRFGGPQVRRTDIAFESMQLRLGRAMHERWRKEAKMNGDETSWESIGLGHRRSSMRAALSAVELFQTLGLVPPAGAAAADLRLYKDLTKKILNIDARILTLAASEHNRWVAERLSEGWTQTTAEKPSKDDKNDRRKIHWLLMDHETLRRTAPKEIKKDSNNIRAIFEAAEHAYDVQPRAPRWRKRVRVGLMGSMQLPLGTDMSKMVVDLWDWMRANDIDPLTHQLEVVTPNAPGFDRVAATALLLDWTRRAGQPANLLRLEAEELASLDLHAAHKATPAEAAAQTAALSKAARGHNRRITLKGGPLTKEAFLEEVDRGAHRMSKLCDVMIYCARPGEGKRTRANAALRAKSKRNLIWFEEPAT